MTNQNHNNRPQYRLKAYHKPTGNRGEVGAAWVNDDGSLTLKLNPCVVLTYDSNIVLTLFPVEEPKPFPPKKDNPLGKPKRKSTTKCQAQDQPQTPTPAAESTPTETVTSTLILIAQTP